MTKRKILLAEDDENFGLMLKSFLTLNNYNITWAKNGEEALDIAKNNDFDLYICDVMMPLMDGFHLANELRNLGKKQPLIFLTAKSMKEDKVQGYKAGAVDYLVKPFDPDILSLKIEALFEHYSKSTGEHTELTIGSFKFNTIERTLILADFKKRLSPKESALLQMLIEYKNRLLPREEALLKIWNDDGYFPTQSMNVFITKLRGHLKKDPNYHLEIENIRGSGFILRESAR